MVTALSAGCAADGDPGGSAPAPSPDYAGTLEGRVQGFPGGLGVSVTLMTDEPTTIASGALELDGVQTPVIFSPRDGRDLDGPEIVGPLTVAAGVDVVISSGGSPDCGVADHAPPILDLVVSDDDGATTHRRYLVASPAGDYARIAARTCRGGVVGHIRASRQSPDGSFSVTLELVNPDAQEVTVVSDAVDVGRTHWQRASVVVAARGTAKLVVRGRGQGILAGCGHDTPWSRGLVTAGGDRVRIPRSADVC